MKYKYAIETLKTKIKTLEQYDTPLGYISGIKQAIAILELIQKGKPPEDVSVKYMKDIFRLFDEFLDKIDGHMDESWRIHYLGLIMDELKDFFKDCFKEMGK